MMHKVACSAMFLLLSLGAPCVVAAGNEANQGGSAAAREANERAARKACLTGDYAKGVEILADRYLDTRDPTYIFNQGRCYEQNNRCADAIGSFREYLRKATDASEADRKDAEKHIADCQAVLGKGQEVPAQPPPPSVAAPAASSANMAPPTPVAVALSSSAPPGKPGYGLRVAGIGTAVIGAAAFVTAIILNVKSNGLASDLEKNYSSSTDSTRKDYTTAAWVGYAAGGVCLAGGAVLYYLGVRKAQSVSAAPVIMADGAGVVLAGGFQ